MNKFHTRVSFNIINHSRVNFCKSRDRPLTREDSNFLILCSNDVHSELLQKELFQLFEKCQMVQLKSLVLISESTSIEEL